MPADVIVPRSPGRAGKDMAKAGCSQQLTVAWVRNPDTEVRELRVRARKLGHSHPLPEKPAVVSTEMRTQVVAMHMSGFPSFQIAHTVHAWWITQPDDPSVYVVNPRPARYPSTLRARTLIRP
jgi:hypothetical protein